MQDSPIVKMYRGRFFVKEMAFGIICGTFKGVVAGFIIGTVKISKGVGSRDGPYELRQYFGVEDFKYSSFSLRN